MCVCARVPVCQTFDWHVAGVGPVGITDVQELKAEIEPDTDVLDVGEVAGGKSRSRKKKVVGKAKPEPAAAKAEPVVAKAATPAPPPPPAQSVKAAPVAMALPPLATPPINSATGSSNHSSKASMYDDFTADSPRANADEGVAPPVAAPALPPVPPRISPVPPPVPPRTSSLPSNSPVFTDDESEESEDEEGGVSAPIAPGALEPGSVCKTPYGDAYVMDSVREDGVVQLHLGWGQVFYHVGAGEELKQGTPIVSLPPPTTPEPRAYLTRVKGVENVDLTEIVSGHLEYRLKLEEVLAVLGFGRDLASVTTLQPPSAKKRG